MVNSVVYPGSFDPVTLGHDDIIRRCARLFDNVTIAVAASAGKIPFFDIETRVSLVEACVRDLQNIKVVSFSGLLIDFLREHDESVVMRGVRSNKDFEYENMLAATNKKLMPELETVFLMPSEGVSMINASLIREIVSMGGDVSTFVPDVVAAALVERS